MELTNVYHIFEKGEVVMYNGGEIIIVNNIMFKNRYADHASLVGRPCIILSDYNDKITLLPLTSEDSYSYENRINTVVFCSDDYESVKKSFKLKKKNYANLSSMFQRDLRYHDIVAYLSLRRYAKLLEEIEEKRLEYNKYCGDIYKEIYSDLEFQRNELSMLLTRKK